MTSAPLPNVPAPTDEPPRWAPWYGIGFLRALDRFFRKYADFTGRASRSEYWWWILWAVIISSALSLVGAFIDLATGFGADTDPTSMQALTEAFLAPSSWISYVFAAAVIVPSWAVAARRLHDTNRSGWWQLLSLIPFVGGVILLVWYASAPRPEGTRFDRP